MILLFPLLKIRTFRFSLHTSRLSLLTGSAALIEKKIPYFFQTFPNFKFHFFETRKVATHPKITNNVQWTTL